MSCVNRSAQGAFALIGFALVAASSPAATTPSSDAAATLLRERLDAPKTVSYIGEVQTIRFSTNKAVATIVRVEHLAPDRTRKWYMAPEAVYGDYTITRGITTYQVDIKHGKVFTSRNPSIVARLWLTLA